MSAKTLPTGFEVAGRELTITRLFNAPRALVFDAYTKPEYLKRWWGPSQWPVVACTVDLRPGGKWHYCMKSIETGDESWGVATYSEVVVPERLVYEDAFADADGHVNEGLPVSMTTLTFEDLGQQTRITSHTVYPTAADLETVIQMGMIEGITECYGQLEALLAAEQA
jgi:uncharacterized protein YndB with AHSA1/START domain